MDQVHPQYIKYEFVQIEIVEVPGQPYMKYPLDVSEILQRRLFMKHNPEIPFLEMGKIYYRFKVKQINTIWYNNDFISYLIILVKLLLFQNNITF